MTFADRLIPWVPLPGVEKISNRTVVQRNARLSAQGCNQYTTQSTILVIASKKAGRL